jgi:EAL domain-containing protein (putative c-di-GMP-specific phosphodiesterase class I)
MTRRLTVLQNARDALARNAVIPYYQPKIDLKTGAVAGFEALLRWVDERGELRSPDRLAEAFEDPTLALAIGSRMLERVVADMTGWAEAGLPFRHVALNVADAEFAASNLLERIVAALTENGLSPAMLEVEVTETVFLSSEADGVAETLTGLHWHGVSIALDDFGTGHASLRHLKLFPVSTLKIDRSFIKDMMLDRDAREIVNAVIGLAQALGIRIVAEGIETEAQMTYLRRRGCDIGQGFLFAKAMPASRVPHFLASFSLRPGEALTSAA